MNSIREIINTPYLDKVEVEFNGTVYYAEEIDIRHLQDLIASKIVDKNDFKIYDKDVNGNRYEMKIRDDGVFENNFTCNILSLNAEKTLRILGEF